MKPQSQKLRQAKQPPQELKKPDLWVGWVHDALKVQLMVSYQQHCLTEALLWPLEDKELLPKPGQESGL